MSVAIASSGPARYPQTHGVRARAGVGTWSLPRGLATAVGSPGAAIVSDRVASVGTKADGGDVGFRANPRAGPVRQWNERRPRVVA